MQISIYFSSDCCNCGFILIPGPIVVATVMLLIYLPLDDCGFALMIASMRAEKFSMSLSLPKDFLPISVCTILFLSNLYSTLPALMS